MNRPVELRNQPWDILTQNGDDEAFFAAWLACMVAQCGPVAQAVVIWSDEPNVGPFRPVALWPDGQAPGEGLAALCERVLEVRLPLTQAMPAPAIAQPILSGSDLHGAVALRFNGMVPPQAADWMRWGMGWMARRIADRDAVDGEAWRERLFVMLDLFTHVLDQERAIAAAQAVITEAAQRLGCERVSLGFASKGTMRLVALSHSASFSGRIDLTRALEAAMNEAADQGQRLICGETLEGPEGRADAFAVLHEHERLRREFDSEVVLSVPFSAGEEEGVFVFEWAYGPVEPDLLGIAEGIVPLLGRALADRRRQDRPWIVKLGHGLAAQTRTLLGPRHGMRKLVALALLAAVAYLTVAQGDFRVAAHARLEGGVRRVIAAPFDGFVASSDARAGQVVKAGATLATLEDRDLSLEAARWESQQTQYLKQAEEAQAQRNLAQLQIALAQARQADAQRRLAETNLQRTVIASPFAGVLVSGDLSQQLGGAVKKGQALFEVAPLDSYRVILDVDEADIAHVAVGQKGELVLSALAGQRFPLSVTLVTPVAQAHEGKNTFRVEATLDEFVPSLRPGMEGVGKVTVEERHLAWIWTRRFLDWMRLQTWVWLGI